MAEKNNTVEIVTIVVALLVIGYLGLQLKKEEALVAQDNSTIINLQSQLAAAKSAPPSRGGGSSGTVNSIIGAGEKVVSILSFL